MWTRIVELVAALLRGDEDIRLAGGLARLVRWLMAHRKQIGRFVRAFLRELLGQEQRSEPRGSGESGGTRRPITEQELLGRLSEYEVVEDSGEEIRLRRRGPTGRAKTDPDDRPAFAPA